MPLSKEQVSELESTQSHYGCGRDTCKACYPVQYACEMCLETFEQPIANGEYHDCENCGWVNNEADDV